jgi:hypothetical protein
MTACNGDDLFGAGVKFCDDDGNAFILQKPPTEDQQGDDFLAGGGFASQTLFAVPGFDSIGDFGLTVETITQLSVASQDANGYLAAPTPEDFANKIAGLNPSDVSVKDAMVFNLPVCDFSKTTIADNNQLSCTSRFSGAEVGAT